MIPTITKNPRKRQIGRNHFRNAVSEKFYYAPKVSENRQISKPERNLSGNQKRK